MLTPGMFAVTYAALTGILVVTFAYATVGLLLALRPGGGRMGAILIVGSAAFAAVPFGYMFAGSMAHPEPPRPGRERARRCWVPRSSRSGTP